MKYNDLQQTLTFFFCAIDKSVPTYDLEEDVLKTFLRKLLSGITVSDLQTVIEPACNVNSEIRHFSAMLAHDPSEQTVDDGLIDALYVAIDTHIHYEESVDTLRVLIINACELKEMTVEQFNIALHNHLDPYETDAETPVFEGSAMADFAKDLRSQYA